MLSPVDRQTADRLKARMTERGVPVLETIVFGSRARGNHDEDSDLDVLVLVTQRTREIVESIRTCAWEVGLESDRYIQTVIRSKDEIEKAPLCNSPFVRTIQTEGIRV